MYVEIILDERGVGHGKGMDGDCSDESKLGATRGQSNC